MADTPRKRNLPSLWSVFQQATRNYQQLFRGCTVRCARAVRKVGYFGPIFPDGRGDTVMTVFLYTELLSPKPQIMS